MVELLAIAVITSIGRPLAMASLLRELAMCLSGQGPDRREPDEKAIHRGTQDSETSLILEACFSSSK
ncbi:MAG: hypothetical protein AAGA26_05975 [Pseudomonadota bacterium]